MTHRLASVAAVMVLATASAAMAQDGFSQADFDKLSFLEGRWSGAGPDGKPFFDLYDRPEPGVLRSRRYADATFAEATDESRTILEDGQILSRWATFSWKASEVADGRAVFEPVEAPSAFSWIRTAPDTVEVTQRFAAPDGSPRSYTLTLTRVR